jgi:hypothetical protein
MIRKGLLLLLGTGFVACDASDAAILIHGVSKAEVNMTTNLCLYKADVESTLPVAYLDTAASYGLTLPFIAENNLAPVESEVGTMDTTVVSKFGNLVSPVRYSVQWECDNTAFSGGALIIPHFDVQNGFCYDQRAEQSPSSFFGFDVVPVAGSAIEPTALGIFQATVIPPEFGQYIDDAFQLATLADSCCIESKATNCDGTGGGPSCTELANRFAILDRNGDLGLQVESEEPGEPSADIIRFQPFAVFDGSHAAQTNKPGNRNFGAGTMYSLRQRGVFEVVSTDGQTFQSAQTNMRVDIGRNMGPYWDVAADCQSVGNASAPCRLPVFDGCYNR